GGLQALDEIFARRRADGSARGFGLNDFDIFVGLSAGSVLASVLSAGITPEEIVQILLGESDRYEAVRARHFMWPNLEEEPRRLVAWLEKEQEILTNYLSGATSDVTGEPFSAAQTVIKMLTVSARLLPTGIFNPQQLERYLRRNMERAGIANHFVEQYG